LSDLDPLSPKKAVEMYLNHRRGELADETVSVARLPVGAVRRVVR